MCFLDVFFKRDNQDIMGNYVRLICSLGYVTEQRRTSLAQSGLVTVVNERETPRCSEWITFYGGSLLHSWALSRTNDEKSALLAISDGFISNWIAKQM